MILQFMKKKERFIVWGFEKKYLNHRWSSHRMGVPVGLVLMKNKIDKDHIKQYGGGVVDNSLYNKLLHLAEQRKTTNSTTRKFKSKRRNKTRKH